MSAAMNEAGKTWLAIWAVFEGHALVIECYTCGEAAREYDRLRADGFEALSIVHISRQRGLMTWGQADGWRYNKRFALKCAAMH